MHTAATTILDVTLDDPADEDRFMRWWDDARRLLVTRARMTLAELHVLGRGRYVVVLGFPLPGTFKVVAKDRPWRDLVALRPPARVEERSARLWHRAEQPVDITTGQLAAWLEERRAGRRDLVVIDTMPHESYAEGHLPGAVSLPLAALDEAAAARVIGDRGRAVVVYCSSYG